MSAIGQVLSAIKMRLAQLRDACANRTETVAGAAGDKS
jgi:hypothetical protein